LSCGEIHPTNPWLDDCDEQEFFEGEDNKHLSDLIIISTSGVAINRSGCLP